MAEQLLWVAAVIVCATGPVWGQWIIKHRATAESSRGREND